MTLRDVSLSDKYERDGDVFLTGVQALVRLPALQHLQDRAAGLKTAGFVTGYPGSPLASFDTQLRLAKGYLDSNSVRFQPGLNEDLAMTSVWGTQQGEVRGDSKYDGVFSIWYGKGAGLDRSGDALRHGNLAGSSEKGGVLLLIGDDHRAESSSVAHYGEFTLVDFMIPALNPATIEDLIEFGLFGFAMSRFTGSWVGLKCLHDVVESAATVNISSHARGYTTPSDFIKPAGGLNLRYPDSPLAQEHRLHSYRIDSIKAFARANKIDKAIWRKPTTRLGVVTTGRSYVDVLEALVDLGIDERRAADLGIAIYKVGMSWPIEPSGMAEFCEGLEALLVVEEKRSLIETQLKELLFHRAGAPTVLGKYRPDGTPLFPSAGILTSNNIALEIGHFILEHCPKAGIEPLLEKIKCREGGKTLPVIPLERKPTFCSGCPHNRSTVVPEGSRGGAGTGCNYMVMWMDRGSVGYTQMGADGTNWIGEAPFSNRKHVFQNLGDGTYTHSGLLAIRASVAANVNITFKVLFNSVVAMTGGQPHELALSAAIIARQVLAEGAKRVVVVTDDPHRISASELPEGVELHHRDALERVQNELKEVPGVSVLIYDQMCANEKRRRRKRQLLDDPPKRAFINHLVCEGCGDCGTKSSCISVLPRETEFGRKRIIDQHSCNKDFSCVEGFCPSFVTIAGGRPRKRAASFANAGQPIPEPDQRTLDRPYNIVLAGLGGSGIITLAAILGMAAHLEEKGCATLDMMGLAQKGGAVTSHVRIGKSPTDVWAARVPGGCADLVLGGDFFAVAGHEPMSTVGQNTVLVANTAESMPGEFVRQPDLQFPSEALKRRLSAASPRQIIYLDATKRCRQDLGDTIVSNTFLLGFAFQKGLVPISSASIEAAFKINAVDVDLNVAAFQAGRLAALDTKPQDVECGPENKRPDAAKLIEQRVGLLTNYQNGSLAAQYRDFVQGIQAEERARIGSVGSFSYAVAFNLAKLMTYKDEYEVARLYSSGEFEQEVREQFEGNFRLRFHLAPPLLARRDPTTGHLRKMTFGPWLMVMFRVLARFKFLRGTSLDPFGYTAERKEERKLISDYRELISSIVTMLSEDSYQLIVDIASLPEQIRGYGHVKENSIKLAQAKQAALLAQLYNGVTQAAAE